MSRQFEWLTAEICDEFKKRAEQLEQNNGNDSAEWRKLRLELQGRCNLTEIEAVNILRGYNVKDYLQKYGLLSGEIPTVEVLRKRDNKARTEYEKKMDELEERVAELEILERQSKYGFEEND